MQINYLSYLCLCEHGDEPLVSIKFQEILNSWKTISFRGKTVLMELLLFLFLIKVNHTGQNECPIIQEKTGFHEKYIRLENLQYGNTITYKQCDRK
jgi:hypothetical protein